MTTSLLISVLAAFLISTADAAGSKKAKPLRDGFVLAGVDGKLAQQDSNEGWSFEFDSDVSDDKGRVGAGESLELLPSATLEKITVDTQMRSTENYRLWGRVTKYKDRNFIFPIYFLPLSQISHPQPATSQKPQRQNIKMIINEPNGQLAIPRDIIAKLKTRRIVRPEQLQKGLELKADCIIADRTAFLADQPESGVTLVLDALGRNIPQVSFTLLPCEALEGAQHKQSAEADPLRFKIAGIVTKYKGEHYLLLQRARRVYNHENFGR